MSDEEKEVEEKFLPDRRILIEYTDPLRPSEIIEIPGDYKVTFGPWSPRSKGSIPNTVTERANQLRPGWILRVYEAKEKQRAVFTNVEAFRDLAIPLFRGKVKLVPDDDPDPVVTSADNFEEIKF